MKKIISWSIAVCISYLIVYLSYKFYLYSFVYKNLVIDFKEEIIEENYVTNDGEYINIAHDIFLNKEIMDKYNLSFCVRELKTCTKEEIIIHKFSNELSDLDQDGELEVNKFYYIKEKEMAEELKKYDSNSLLDSYYKSLKNDDKISLFSSNKKIKSAIIKSYIFKNRVLFGFDKFYHGDALIMTHSKNDYSYLALKSNNEKDYYLIALNNKLDMEEFVVNIKIK